ncbi:unnamed protein product [Larinioides sclopetarius]|uniref:Ubiquitin-like domain-containing protein n=1 Tax=Larinioides sclopetarius TaxID=280406 RepID=A0AAV2BEW2_9ARAC
MDVYLMIRRKKTSIFLDANEKTTVYEVKKMIRAIINVLPENQQLYMDNKVMRNNKCLEEYGLNHSKDKPENPAIVGLACRESENSEFEILEIMPYTTPPELPAVLRILPEMDSLNT